MSFKILIALELSTYHTVTNSIIDILRFDWKNSCALSLATYVSDRMWVGFLPGDKFVSASLFHVAWKDRLVSSRWSYDCRQRCGNISWMLLVVETHVSCSLSGVIFTVARCLGVVADFLANIAVIFFGMHVCMYVAGISSSLLIAYPLRVPSHPHRRLHFWGTASLPKAKLEFSGCLYHNMGHDWEHNDCSADQSPFIFSQGLEKKIEDSPWILLHEYAT